MKAYMFPGQGSQVVGMGEELFDRYADLVDQASEHLGYSVAQLCLEGPKEKLGLTQFTQPALYIVNALSYLAYAEQHDTPPAYLVGHSLGEYDALFAAGSFDFLTGLKLVSKRGELMSTVKSGGMAAVLKLSSDEVISVLRSNGIEQIDIANHNSREQIVISGPSNDLLRARPFFEQAGGMYISLNVSAAFHSRYMMSIRSEFEQTLKSVEFSQPKVPVLSNVTAAPYSSDSIARLLVSQLTHPVKWYDSMCYLLEAGVTEFVELGPGNVLTGLSAKIRQHYTTQSKEPAQPATSVEVSATDSPLRSRGTKIFTQRYRLRRPYAAGSMYKGISSEHLVIAMARNGYLSFLGSGGLSPENIVSKLNDIQKNVNGAAYGINLLSQPASPERELSTARLIVEHRVPHIEASGYITISLPLALCRLKGIRRTASGELETPRTIMAKVSRPEVAERFLSPVPPALVQQLLDMGEITADEAALATQINVADDICVEADSAGHTDRGNSTTLLPAIVMLRNRRAELHKHLPFVCVGCSGGIGTPEAAASAFILGADFILTGSVNQCSVESGAHDVVKSQLQTMGVRDTGYAPAGDMFELGAEIQVLKKGGFFPARARRLRELWLHYSQWEDVPKTLRDDIEQRYFRESFESVIERLRSHYSTVSPDIMRRADEDPKFKMALAFRWYFHRTNQLALDGDVSEKENFQIHVGPALGAFNAWVMGSDIEDWRSRHVNVIADRIMDGAEELLRQWKH